ncbi:MAG: Dna2/Cas4 domain-containing protein, partial [Dolichospermum sp.]
YAQTHQRQIVEITPKLRTNTIATIEAIKMLLFTGAMPKAIKTKRCDGCSFRTDSNCPTPGSGVVGHG